jgi:hypothetical protein
MVEIAKNYGKISHSKLHLIIISLHFCTVATADAQNALKLGQTKTGKFCF